jgi:hypothetical protein
MIKTIKKFTLIIPIIFVYSCSGISDAGKVLRNEKIKTTDEFLVKKRAPLTLPPQYDTIPRPKSLEKKNDDDKINKILKIPNEEKSKDLENTSVEQSIINQIRK